MVWSFSTSDITLLSHDTMRRIHRTHQQESYKKDTPVFVHFFFHLLKDTLITIHLISSPRSPVSKKTMASPAVFHYKGLTIEVHHDVYDPAEDTFLLLGSTTIDTNERILELGTGCGLIALDCARRGAQVLCTDINPFAVELTRKNIERNRPFLKGTIDVRQGDLFSVVTTEEHFDMILFNPPYLPTTTKDKTDRWFDIATDGGRDGLKVTKRFLHDLPKHLTSSGRAYFIVSSLSPRGTLERFLKKERFTARIVASQRFESETLDVYCVTPTA